MSENLLFIMSLSGTVVFLLYVICYPLAKRVFPLRWRYLMLKVALVFYLIPFSLLKYSLLSLIYDIFPETKSMPVFGYEQVDSSKMVLYTGDNTFVPWRIKIMWFIAIIVGLISLGIIFRQISWYLKIRSLYLKDAISVDDDWQCLMNGMKDKMGIKCHINFVISEFCDTPMTVGVFSPSIVLPIDFCQDKSDTNWKYMIQHELNHVKNKDLLIRFIALFVMVIHWFNPICYILYNEISNISEIYCDYCTVKDYNQKQQIEYSTLIVNIATGRYDLERGKFFAELVGGNAKIIERRVLEIKAIGTKKRLILSCIIGGIVCLAGGMTTSAYTVPTTLYTDNSATDSEGVQIIYDYETAYEELPYDYFYIDENGNPQEITNENNGKWICPHRYQDTTVSMHSKNSDNSCETKYYDAILCVLCNRIETTNLKKTVKYTSCPH